MYAAVLSGCLFAAALVPAVPLKTGRVPVSRIMRQPGLSWTGLYDELGRPVTMDELRRHKFTYNEFFPDFQDATDSPTHPIWTERRFYGADGPEPLAKPWYHMKRFLCSSRGSQREGLPYYLYHYTTSDAAAQIFESGKLLPSLRKGGAGDDATEGDGVYFTSIPPWAPRDVVIDNNYDGASLFFNESRAEAYIRIEAWWLSPDVAVVRANVRQNGRGPMKGKERDVYIVPGKEALDLSKSQYTQLITEPEAWHKSNTRQKFIRKVMELNRESEERQAIARESQRASLNRWMEEDPSMDLSEEYARLEAEEHEAQLRLQYPEDELCLDGCLRSHVYPQQRGYFRWELKQAKKQRPRSRRRGRSKTK